MSIDDKSETLNNDSTTTLQNMDDHEKELHLQAESDFKKKQFSSCLKCIEKLLENINNGDLVLNKKLLNNKAICESSLKNYQNLNEFDNLSSLLKINLDDLNQIEDADNRILFYNYAIIQFNNKNYKKCLIIMEKIYQYHETLDENFSKDVVLLLINTYLVTYQPTKVLNIINSHEKQYLNVNQPITKLSGGDLSLKKWNDDQTNDLKYLFSLFKLKSYFQLKALDLCDKELEYLSQLTLNNHQKINLIYKNSYNEFINKNHRKSIEYLCSILKTIPPQSSQNEQIKQQQLLLLNKVLINNNISAIYYYTKKFNLSSFYLRRAIQDNSKLLIDIKTQVSKSSSSSLISLCIRNLNYKYELLYNLGVNLLHNKQPLQSFDCFIEILTSTFKYAMNSRIWLRIAECCIMVYRKNEDMCKLSEKVRCIQKSTGMHIYHKIVFNTHLSKPVPTSQHENDTTLDFAYLCLKNAFHLLNNARGDLIAKESGGSGENVLIDCCQPSSAITINEFNRLTCSVLVSLSYVSLCLNDYLSTMKYCNLLLNDCKMFISSGNRYLAQNYLAEALLFLDKISESIEILNNNLDLKSISFETSNRSNFDENPNLVDWYPNDSQTSRGIVFHNLSVAHAIRSEIDMAKVQFDNSVKSFDKQLPANIFYMKIYLDLLEGNRNSLQVILREHFGHSTINRSYQPINKIQTKPSTPTNNNSATSPPQLNPPTTTTTSNALQQFLTQQQQQQLPPQLLQTLQQSQSSNNLLQQHTQLLQLAQQQQYLNQLNAAAAAAALNPNPIFNLQSLHLGAQISQLTPPPGTQLNLAQQANFQNALNNLNSNAVNQLLLQQQQQAAAVAAAAQISGSNNGQTNSFLNALQSKIS